MYTWLLVLTEILTMYLAVPSVQSSLDETLAHSLSVPADPLKPEFNADEYTST
jgi:hypothetical protein